MVDQVLNQDLPFITDQQNYATTVRFPPFWTSKPEVWFSQVEAQFSLAKISNDRKKYDHILALLPIEVINDIYDVIQNPPEHNLFDNLKTTILVRLSSSEEKRLDDLLTGSQMGDRKPSEFYRHMLGIVGGTHMVSQDLLVKLWKRRLPKTIFVAITASGKTNIEEIIDIADKIWESCQNPVMSPVNRQSDIYSGNLSNSSDSAPTIANLLDQFNTFSTNFQSTLNQIVLKQQSLELQISTLQTNSSQNQSPAFPSKYCSNCQNRSRSTTRSSSRNRFDTTNNTVCYYHQLYKERAFKCGGSWCIFNKNHSRTTSTTVTNSPLSKNG